MRHKIVCASAMLALIGCSSDSTTRCCIDPAETLRVVNAFTAPVDVLVDGNTYITSLAAGTIATTSTPVGNHTLMFRASGATSAVSQQVTTAAGALNTIAVLRAESGALLTSVLDDTNSVVPANATKVRVLHMAANAGTLQVYRTQPDYQKPISWQFPFTYQSAPNSLSAPFYQSTPGTWEIHVWQTPSDSSGWANAPVKVLVPLAAGEKRTILILDKVGGGVRVETF